MSMRSPAPPTSKSGTASPASPAEGASGYLLLTIDHAVVKQVYAGETMVLAKGQLRLQCVSLPIPAEIGYQTANPFAPSPSDPPVPTHDFWLMVHVGATFEMPAIPEQLFKPQPDNDGITYAVASAHVPGASILFTLPKPTSAAAAEDLQSFETLIRQYGCLAEDATALSGVAMPSQAGGGPSSVNYLGSSPPPAPEELRGRLVLVNEDNGEIIGEMDQRLDVEEDGKIAGGAKNQPVMLDFEQLREGQDALRVKVKTVPAEELDDWMLRGAHQISAWSGRQMMSGADRYIKSTTPRAEPVKFSPETRENFMKVHRASVKTATVTKSTLNKLHGAIATVAEKSYQHGVKPAMNAYESMAPPVPPRPAAKPANLSTGQYAPPPRRSPSPSAVGYQVAYPTQSESLLALEDKVNPPPAYGYQPRQPRAGKIPVPEPVPTAGGPYAGDSSVQGQSQSPKKRGLLSRVVLAGEVVFTSLEATAHDLINNGTIAASSAAGHKYGYEAGEATALIGGSVKNVAVVYIDVAGTGRRALLKSTAKGFVKAKLKDGETVTLQAEGHGADVKAGEAEREGGQIVVGMPEVGAASGVEARDTAGLSKRQ
ncbi:hypothetical protein IAT38_002921 [Cryptococcus sp. DSM 104549]